MTMSIDILLVEDNPGDVLLTQEALADSALLRTLRVVDDGAAALAQLRADYCSGALPDLVVLDVRLPGMSGHELLAAIKADGDLEALPVVMLSSSSADDDVLASYKAHASCYVAKPTGLDDYVDVVRSIEEFWCSTVRLPRRS